MTDDLAATWGIGCYDGEDARRPWPIGDHEMRRDIARAPQRLAALGVGSGDRVLFCSMLSEAGQFWPLIVGTMLSGAQLSCADATAAEAPRVALFLRHMTYRAVVGVNDAILDGLDELDVPYRDVFEAVDVLAARPGAFERLVAAGLAPRRFALCGPAVALADAGEPDAPAYVDDDEWHLDATAGRVLVTNHKPRHTRFDRVAVGVRAEVVADGKAVTWPSGR
jgi:hypothetical protein